MDQSLKTRARQSHLGLLPRGLAFAFLMLLAFCSRPVSAQMPSEIQIGEVYYYGYGGLDLDKIKTALPIQVGDRIPAAKMSDTLHRASTAIKSITGHAATDLAPVCCDPQGHWILYVGLPGTSSHPFHYNAVPTGTASLPANISTLYQHLMNTIMKAVQNGHASEDDSQGYALTADPDAHSLQMKLHQYALTHTNDICHVLTSSASADQRQVSAMALGYAPQSSLQLRTLIQASRDPDGYVRNNATRALMVLASGRPQMAKQISAGPFIAMLNSGTWTDRNKGGFLLSALSTSRNPILLSQIRKSALPSLIEMAHWDTNHAGAALMILGRIGGIPESKLPAMIQAGHVDDIVNAAQGTTSVSSTISVAPPASPATPVHLTITGTQTTLGDALLTISHQTGTTILTESTVASKTLTAADVTQPSLEAMLTQLISTMPGVVWEKVTLPQGQALPTADAFADTMRVLELVSLTQVTAQNSGSQTNLLFSKTTVASGTSTVTKTGMQTVYLVRNAGKSPANSASPATQITSNMQTIADLLGKMTPDQQSQALKQMMPQVMRMMQSLDPSVQAQLFSQFGQGN